MIYYQLITSKIDFLINCRTPQQFWGFINRTAGYQARRELIWESFNPAINFIELADTAPINITVVDALNVISIESIRLHWQKALERKQHDSEGAITTSRSLIESVCKHILDERGVEYEDTTDLPSLYKLTASQLNLSPEQHTEKIFKQILNGCKSVVEGLGAVRNKHGDSHGKGKYSLKPAPRHAELAVNLAGTMASFLLQTHSNLSFLEAASQHTITE